jgi:hypothetical protein
MDLTDCHQLVFWGPYPLGDAGGVPPVHGEMSMVGGAVHADSP